MLCLKFEHDLNFQNYISKNCLKTLYLIQDNALSKFMLLLMYQIMLFVSKKDLKLKYHTIYDSLFP